MARHARATIKTLIFLASMVPLFMATSATAAQDSPASVFAANNTTGANTPTITPPQPNLNAKGYILVDANTGEILAAKNVDQHMAPASLTKLMSLYLIANALSSNQVKLTDQVQISKNAWQTGGSRMFIRAGSQVPVDQLIQGIIVDSGNDATVAMAEYMAGSTDAFVPLMNAQAKNLGMQNTNYEDPTGLPNPNHYSSPRDMAILARAFITNHPEFYTRFKQQYFTFDNIKQANRNKLLWRDPSVDGVKTGFTDDAGYCLVASAVRNGMRLISVVMGAPTNGDRYDFNQVLLNYGYRFYKTYHVYQADEVISHARAWMGTDKYVPLGIGRDLAITIPVGKYQDVKADIALNTLIQAPVVKGASYGQLTLTLNDKTLVSVPIVALANDPKGNIFTQLSDFISLKLQGMFNHSDNQQADQQAKPAA